MALEVDTPDGLVRLRRPGSHAVRVEVLLLCEDSTVRSCGAALGVCWVGKRRPRTSFAACKENTRIYGGKVFDELIDRGWTEADIFTIGLQALEVLSGQKAEATVQEIADAAGFTVLKEAAD